MKRSFAGCIATLLTVAPAMAADPAVREKLIVEGNVVALKDGGTIVIDKDGKTYHRDAAGKRVRMKNGAVMEGKDGRKYLHRNDVVWQQITEKGTLAPNR
jgi:cytoskeletal protein CcmA (bactofilin family)